MKKGLKRRTVNARVDQLRRIFKWGVAHELIPPATLQALEAAEGLRTRKTTAPESAKVKGVSIELVEACIAAMPPTLAAMVRLQLLTGMRAAELCQLRRGDLNTAGDVWTFTRRNTKPNITATRRKSKSGRGESTC